ncbi:MAG: ABC transporter permease [Halanaerobiaceae bacterium]|nr:ABC transporter permease [Halanaerobiaceae bacterium]
MSFFTSRINKRLLTGTAGILVVLVLWGLLARRYHPLILPSPAETFQALKGLWNSGRLWQSTLITLKRTAAGYSLAVLTGLFFAVLLRSNRFCRYLFRPLFTIIQTIPPVIWLVFAVIWFGIADDLTPVFLIFIVTFPVIFVNIFTGLDSIDLRLVEMARVYRSPGKRIIFKIYLPALIPHLVSAVSIGASFAWKSTIFAEFIGSSRGVGFDLSMANSNLETEKLFAWALVLIILMLAFEYGILQPVKRYVTRWNYDEEK